MKTKYLKYASLICWCIGIIFMVVAFFTTNKWISIPMVIFLLAGSFLNYLYTRKTYVIATPEDCDDADDKTDTQ